MLGSGDVDSDGDGSDRGCEDGGMAGEELGEEIVIVVVAAGGGGVGTPAAIVGETGTVEGEAAVAATTGDALLATTIATVLVGIEPVGIVVANIPVGTKDDMAGKGISS